MKIIARDIPPRAAWALEQAGVHPLLARLYAARGVRAKDELDDGLGRLLPPSGLKGIDAAARLLADAMAQNKRLCIVADYDCDGATACAVGVRGLRLLGATHVDYLVPDRVTDGYGLTASIARRVAERGADVLITVDNGIASVEGVAEAKALVLRHGVGQQARGGVDAFEAFFTAGRQQTAQAVVQLVLGAHAAGGIQARQQRVHTGLLQRPGGAGGNVSCYYFHSLSRMSVKRWGLKRL